MLNPLSFISRIFKSSNDIELVKFRKILEKINSLENDVSKIKDSDFPNKTNELKNLIKIGKTLDEVLPECLDNHNDIKKALSCTEISGRFQYLSRSPDIVLDVAHNEDAAKSLATNIKNIGHKNLNVVLGVLADKDVYSIVEPFSSLVNHWYIGTINSERGMNSDEIKYRINSIYKNKLSMTTYSSVTDAFNIAKDNQSYDSLLLVYGSFYTVAEAMKAHMLSQKKKEKLCQKYYSIGVTIILRGKNFKRLFDYLF